MKVFMDRVDAGRQLAKALEKQINTDAIVLAIPRGGVIVGAEVAKKFNLPLDLVIPRKVGVPFNPEVALGAVTQDGTFVYDRELMDHLGLTEEKVASIVKKEAREVERRLAAYRSNSDYPDYDGRQLILVDDGVATGYTLMAAARSVRKMFNPRELILAIPVAPPDTAQRLALEADKMVCLLTPPDFYSVSQYYSSFDQTSDQEVVNILTNV